MIQFFTSHFLNTLTLGQWLILALVPPAIVALYFLKLRRQPLQVPSTYLWSRAIEDLHVNSLWQRLRQSLLLLLQLLLIGLLIFTLVRPGWKGTELVGSRLIFMVDTSASMNSADVKPTRLDSAKQQALALIEQMKPGDVAMVISFSNVAKVEQTFTDNRRLLRQKVELIAATNRSSDLSEALRAASGLANPGQTGDPNNKDDIQTAEAQPATMYLFTDGGFNAVPTFRLGNLKAEYVKVASAKPRNIGIVAFSTDANPEKPGQIQAFARVENYGLATEKAVATLYVNDIELDSQNVEVAGRDPKNDLPGAAGVKFEMDTIENGVLKLELEIKDDLPLDNRAYTVVNLPQPAKILLLTPGNDALELALATDEAVKMAKVTRQPPKYMEDKKYLDAAADSSYDLIIYDQCAPKQMPNCNTLFIGTLPPGNEWQAAPKAFPTIVRDVNQLHPLSQLLAMENVKILESTPLTGPPGSTPLMEAYVGQGADTKFSTIYMIGPRAGYEDAVLGFEIVGVDEKGDVVSNTDWMRRRSFPVFVLNAIKYLGGVRTGLAMPSVKPGAPAALRALTAVKTLTVRSPRGEQFAIDREAQNQFIFTRTDDLGVYDVREGSGDKVSQKVAVNLFDPRESNLEPREKIEIGEEISAQKAKQVSRQELWRWLLLGAIGLLIFEWYVYNRRVYL
ncbi:vWA domain-containing protein [Anatilimnocola floriformis]|uniref:vWA domain-containing protein n=1 Tax=Anatilimnocola floriformis TaxID=2948575 RepID=UPI0020C4D7FC|nr:BatA and WFA domain-containing protein [Anatilimnocola floriformis]